MARMHARRRGKSSSKKPAKKVKPDWFEGKKGEITDLVVKLFKQEHSMSEIGLILRDQYGVPSVKLITGKSIKQILKDEKLLPNFPEDIMNLMKKAVRLRKHVDKNKEDVHNKRALHLVESKIRRLVHYYKSKNEIKKDWYYSPEGAALIVRE